MKYFIFLFSLPLVLFGCAFAPVNHPDINKYSFNFLSYKKVNLPLEDALNISKSALEAMGYEIQSITPDVGVIRTKSRTLLIADYCDCGTWNLFPVSGSCD